MRFIILILIIFLSSCSEKLNTKENKLATNQEGSISENQAEDSTIYIGLVEDFYFSDKPEFILNYSLIER